jgi:hypothetical protein
MMKFKKVRHVGHSVGYGQNDWGQIFKGVLPKSVRVKKGNRE